MIATVRRRRMIFYLGEVRDATEAQTAEKDLAEFGQPLISGEVKLVDNFRFRIRRFLGYDVSRSTINEEKDDKESNGQMTVGGGC